VRTVALMVCRHNGQSGRLEAQVMHATKWAQGNITTPNSWSKQILQRRASFKRRFSSSKSEKQKEQMLVLWVIRHTFIMFIYDNFQKKLKIIIYLKDTIWKVIHKIFHGNFREAVYDF
jgi:hypothetical protein